MAGPGERPAWPSGWGIGLMPRTRRPRPAVLVGGSPLRVLRLAPAGAAALNRLSRGAPGGPGASGIVARRLISAGLAAPVPAPGGTPVRWSVVIPVRDRPAGLAATLDALAVVHGAAVDEMVVVDDASRDAAATRAVTTGRKGVRLIERRTRGGPGAARNTGWRATAGDVVVFVDADCTPTKTCMTTLLDHFADQALGAVAPRIASVPGPSVRERYERHRSPLDLGPVASPVRPGAAVAYVPSATLAVRRRALEEAGGFDRTLSVGEDVDLVWRLARSGWAVRYEPAARVMHPPRPSWAAWLRQRAGYGASAAPLAARHGDAVAPLAIGGAGALTWVIGLAAGWGPGVVTASVATAVAARSLPARTGLPASSAAALAARGQLLSGRAVAEALRRPWWPLTALVVAATRRRHPPVARRLVTLVLAPLVAEWWGAGRPLDPVRWIGLRVADDVAYGAGVWFGAARGRSARALLPARSGAPGRSAGG